MARGKSPGDDFDRQFNDSRRKGQDKARRGESHWADDAYLRGIQNQRDADARARQAAQGNSESCGKATLFLLGTLGGIAWFVAEAAGRVI